VAARATIMTGRHGHTNGLTTNAGHPVPMAEHPTLPGVLGASGYQTRAIGKMHFHPVRGHYGFDHMELLHDYFRHMDRHPEHGTPKNHGIGENEMVPVFNTVDESHSMTRWLVDRTIDYFETADPLRPTFAWLSFPKPHPPFDCDPKYWALYEGMDLPEPVHGNWSRRRDDVPLSLLSDTYSLNRVYRWTPPQLRAIRRAYYACITQIDYNLGYLFARLRELGRLEDTWIIFASDHGEMLGDHWLGAKSNFLEGSAHVPLIIRPPLSPWTHGEHCGTDRTDLVCLADLMPTILAMAGVAVPEAAALDGVDLMRSEGAGRKTLVGQCGGKHAVYHGDFQYCFNEAGGDELLFDLRDDPHQQRELIREGAAGQALNELRAIMVRHLERVSPAAVRDGAPVATAEATTERQSFGLEWPGFHSRTVESDVLH
jgi:arylsulfatase A-like enzyme